MDRIEWESLPTTARDAVQRELGSPVKVEQIGDGRRSALAVVAHLAAGRVFLKGAPLDHERAAAHSAVRPALTRTS